LNGVIQGIDFSLLKSCTQDVTIKKLTRGNPTMEAKFAELKNPDASEAE
jgi:hypothetical protein